MGRCYFRTDKSKIVLESIVECATLYHDMPQPERSPVAETSHHFSLRLRADLHQRLTRRARGVGGESRSRLATRLIDEGLRMDSHPGIVFRPGPGGRRPGLAGGPDVWEIARVLRDIEITGEKAIEKTAKITGLAVHQIRAVAGYYREFAVDVDTWIENVDSDAEEAYPHRARG